MFPNFLPGIRPGQLFLQLNKKTVLESFSFLTPAWYLFLVIFFALALTVIVYYRAKDSLTFSKKQTWFLALLRFLGLVCLGALLLAPFLKYLQTKTEKPVLVMGQDASQSIALSMNDEQQKTYHNQWGEVIADLEKKFKVVTLSFGDAVREEIDHSYPDQVTNIGEFLEHVQSNYGDQNLGGVIIASDGLFNEGKNPLYLSVPMQAPVFAIALGDTTIKKDAFLQRVFHNDITYLNDRLTIQVDVNAKACTGNAVLTIYQIANNQSIKIESRNILYNQKEFFTSQQFTIAADKPGLQRYRVALSPLAGESNLANNYQDFFIDVLDNRERVLIYAAVPHPDVSAIRQSLDKLSKYELTNQYFGEGPLNLTEFDVVILHQIPAFGKNAQAFIQQLNEKKIPIWYILGASTDINQINAAQSGVSITSKINNTNEVEAAIDPAFNLFTLSDELKNITKTFPPLSSPFGEYQTLSGNQTMLNQSISKIETNYPLLSFIENNDQKIALLAGEGLYKWRLFDYLNHQNHQIFDELIQKTMQFLTVKNDKRRFRVVLTDRIFKENEPVQLDAELYNESYELINQPEVSLKIYNDKKEEFTYTFDRRENYYHLALGLLSPGQYTYKANTNYGGEAFTYDGIFSVEPLQLEAQNTTANHNLLFQLAESKNGAVIYPHDLDQLAELILNREDIKPIQYSQITTEPLINLRWLLLFFFLFLALEWFFRRYFGTY